MERNIIQNEIIYDQPTNTLKVYTNTNSLLSELPLIGIKRLNSSDTILKYNEVGLYNNEVKIGDGTSTFTNLSKINRIEIVDNLTSTSTTSALSANQGKEIKSLIDDINDSRASTDNYGLAKVGSNINSNNGVLSVNDGSTSTKGVVQLSDSTSTNSSTTAATSKAVKNAYDKATIEFTGATSSSDGSSGIVPAPLQGDQNKYLKADKTWDIPYTHPSYTAYTGSPSTNQTPNFGSSFYVSQIISDSSGHITSMTERTITIPSSVVTTTTNGLMSYEDKVKLDTIDTNANAYTLPAASTTTLGGVKIGSNISIGNDNEIYLSNANVLSALNKSTDITKYLRNDGTWAVPPDNNTTYDVATTETAGLMSASDKSKLNTIDFNANNITVDTSMSDSSTNPVQNKIVKSYVDTKVSNLVNSAPETLDTLEELANALGDDPNFATTISTELGTKVDKETGKGLSTNDYTDAEKTKLSGIAESADAVSFSRTLNSGTEIGTITINGTPTKLYSTNNDNTEYEEATTTVAGLMSAEDKVKLNSIDSNANNYTHPNYTAYTGKPIANQTPSFGGSFTISQITSDSSGHITSVTDRSIPNTKASSSVLGLVSIGDNISISNEGVISISNSNVLNALNSGSNTTKYLRNDGSWEVPHDTTYDEATTTTHGLMSSDDKSKLDNIADNANNYSHPTQSAITGKPTTNQSVTLGNSITISQYNVNGLGHVTSATDKTITFNHPSYTSTTGVESSNQTPNFGSTFSISQISSDSTGHITSQTTRTVTIPNTKTSTETFGLVKIGSNLSVSEGIISLSNSNALAALNSGSDTTKYLRNDGSWNVPYTHPTFTAYIGKPTSNLTPAFGDTITISQVTTNTNGHITDITDRTITIPSTITSTDNFGLVKVGSNINVSDGVISVNTASTSQAGIVQLSDTYASNSSTVAATQTSVKSAYDTLNSAKLNISDLINNLITDSTTTAINATQSKRIMKELSKIVQAIDLIECTFLHPNDCIDELNNITEIEPSMPMSGVLATKLENQIARLVQTVSLLATAYLGSDIVLIP